MATEKFREEEILTGTYVPTVIIPESPPLTKIGRFFGRVSNPIRIVLRVITGKGRSYAGCRCGTIIGAGSYGKVFRGWSSEVGPVAIKTCNTKATDANTIPLKRFESEIDILKKNWQNTSALPAFFGDGTLRDGTRFYIMELLHGMSLADYRRNIQAIEPQMFLRIAIELTAAVGSLHQLGIIHRDLGAGNIWVSRCNGPIRILDVGMARPSDRAVDLTEKGKTAFGNIFVTDPSVDAGKPMTFQSDLFSIGCNLFRLWTGEFPWPGPAGTELARHYPNPEYDPLLVQRLEELLPGLWHLIQKLIQIEPEDRPKSYEEVLGELHSIAARSFGAIVSHDAGGREREIKAIRGEMCSKAIANFRRKFDEWVKDLLLELRIARSGNIERAFAHFRSEIHHLEGLAISLNPIDREFRGPLDTIILDTTAYLLRIEGLVSAIRGNPTLLPSLQNELNDRTNEIKAVHETHEQQIRQWLKGR